MQIYSDNCLYQNFNESHALMCSTHCVHLHDNSINYWVGQWKPNMTAPFAKIIETKSRTWEEMILEQNPTVSINFLKHLIDRLHNKLLAVYSGSHYWTCQKGGKQAQFKNIAQLLSWTKKKAKGRRIGGGAVTGGGRAWLADRAVLIIHSHTMHRHTIHRHTMHIPYSIQCIVCMTCDSVCTILSCIGIWQPKGHSNVLG